MGGGKKNRRSSATSSSGSEDGDADWRTAIDSVAATTTFTSSTTNSNGNGVPYSRNGRATTDSATIATREDRDENRKPQKLKHYQIKALKVLDDILERTIEVVRYTNQHIPEKDPTTSGGVRLFKHAPQGILFDHLDELEGPKRKPKILPGEEVDEKSKKFRKQLQSVAVDGADIIAAASTACQKSLSKFEAREAAAKAAAKREEERVAKMKSIRGERWLPSMAREMQTNTQRPR